MFYELLQLSTSRVRKKGYYLLKQTRAFRTLRKGWLLSFTSLPPGETRVREQVAENPFFRNLLTSRHPEAALRDYISHYLVGAAGELGHRKTAVQSLDAPVNRRERILSAQGGVGPHNILSGDGDMLAQFAYEDLQD